MTKDKSLKTVISSSPEELVPSSTSATSPPEPLSLSSFEAYGDGDRVTEKPPMIACRHAI